MVGTRAGASRQSSPRNANPSIAQGLQDAHAQASVNSDTVFVEGNNPDDPQYNQANNNENANNNNAAPSHMDDGTSAQVNVRENDNSPAATTRTPRVNTLALILNDLRLRDTATALVLANYKTLENFVNEMHYYNGNRDAWYQELTTLVDTSRFYRTDRTKLMFLFDYHVHESGLPGVANIHTALRNFSLTKFNVFQKNQLVCTASPPALSSTITGTVPDNTCHRQPPLLLIDTTLASDGESPTHATNSTTTRNNASNVNVINNSTTGATATPRIDNMSRQEQVTFLLSEAADFSDEVLFDNDKIMHSRSLPGTTDTLKAHKLWRPQTALLARDRVNSSPFLTSDLALLSDNSGDVIIFYQALSQVAKSAMIDLLPFHYFDPTKSLWPANQTSHVIFEMNDFLVLKLTKDGVINRSNPALALIYKTKLLESDNHLKAYIFLHTILARAVDRLDADLPPTPVFTPQLTIMEFGTKLITYYSTMAAIGGGVPLYHQSLYFLNQLRLQGVHVDTFYDRLRSLDKHAMLPPDLMLQELTLTIADLRQVATASPHIIHRATTRSQGKPSVIANSNDTRRTNRAKDNTPLAIRPFRTGDSIQCLSCGTWGHTRLHCRSLATYCAVKKYADANGDTCKSILTRWLASQDRSSQVAVVNQLRLLHPDEYADQTDEDIMDLLESSEAPDFYKAGQ